MATIEALTTVNSTVGISTLQQEAVKIVSVCLSLILNAFVFVVIKYQTEIQEYMKILYQILAVADMVLGINWNIWLLLWFSIDNTKVTCHILSMAFPYVFHVLYISVMACLCGISLNLYLLISRPLRYYTIVTRTRFYLAISSVFLLIMLICGIYLPIPSSPFMKLLTERCLAQDLSAKATWTSTVHTIFQIIPICATIVITSILNIRLLLIARQLRNAVGPCGHPLPTIRINRADIDPRNSKDHDPRISPGNLQIDVVLDLNMNRHRPRRRGMKGFATILLTTATFCMVWTPYIIYYVTPLPPTLTYVLDTISGSFPWVQPIIYLLTNSEARRMCFVAFKKCLRN